MGKAFDEHPKNLTSPVVAAPIKVGLVKDAPNGTETIYVAPVEKVNELEVAFKTVAVAAVIVVLLPATAVVFKIVFRVFTCPAVIALETLRFEPQVIVLKTVRFEPQVIVLKTVRLLPITALLTTVRGPLTPRLPPITPLPETVSDEPFKASLLLAVSQIAVPGVVYTGDGKNDIYII
jgi:hypothetical protein